MRHSSKKTATMHPVTVLALAVCLIVIAFVFVRELRQTSPTDSVEAADPKAAPQTVTELPSFPPLPGDMHTVLSPELREVPGETPAKWLYYRHPETEDLLISGSWDAWEEKHELQPVSPGLYAFNLGGLELPFGRYEFKFIHGREWEAGENRILYVNDDGLIERPPRVIAQALIDDERLIRLQLNEVPSDRERVDIQMDPDYGIARMEWVVPDLNPRLSGYRFVNNDVEFVFDPAAYDLSPPAVQRVSVAGGFNGWDPESDHTRMTLQENGEWSVRIPYAYIDGKITDEHIMFKFVVNGEWRNPPEAAPNTMLEPGTPHLNLTLPRGGEGRIELHIHTARTIDLREPPGMIIQGLHERQLRVRPTPGAILDTFSSAKPMGVTLDREAERSVFRLFSPRALRVDLGLFDGPYHRTAENEPVEPSEILPMKRDGDGVWELQLEGLRIGQYYAFRVEGPQGDGEAFNPHRWLGDPYAYAVSLAEGNSIVVDLEAAKAPWEGWSEAARSLRIPREDQVIYETHVRHFTWDESSGVQADLRGSYLGFLATEGLGTGLDHLKALGVNVIQFMPIHEFPNGFEARHDWGYATDFFFAPESSFAQNPREGSQIHEFRHLVNQLKEQGFAVFLDVVYNHIGGVNVFNAIDRKYYFRLNPDFTNMNFSGVGNDVASERPMMRRLIVESVLFWVEEYGIDGFRFDLGELIDDETLLQIEREIREKHPHVVLHSEPWSFRGHHKDFIGRTSWGAWNDQFREPAKRFVSGRGDLDNLKMAIRGSVETWAQHPLQSVNYMESHDDYSLVDEFTANPERDGRQLSVRDERIHKLAATLIMGSLGVPMITEGQDWMRSKHGIRNTYNRGDELNALRWNDRDREHARQVSEYYGQMIRFRLSDAGQALRVADAPSMDYVQFIESGSETALGWIVNGNGERPGIPAVMILMNAGEEARTFEVELPPGRWVQVGDGDAVHSDGIPGGSVVQGDRQIQITVPPQTAFIYRNGF